MTNEDQTMQQGMRHLLTRDEVSRFLSITPETAGQFMKETGRSITIFRRIYLFEDDLIEVLEEMKGGGR